MRCKYLPRIRNEHRTACPGAVNIALIAIAVGGWALGRGPDIPPFILLMSVLLVTGNAMLALCLYTLAAYIGRTYLEVKGRPPYVISESEIDLMVARTLELLND